eukprot:CAMPEP_0173407940 /NCGR_PEP_ID=MMETSP1356-20130122/68442_1 /TAXON_ID=77927 ORGANISM="Hemiselmis virescens, Strain PCC157" /NCGR_SAMPLE_ID=MMETSP1356 /ASSEMBLY_ACC=CAM_ASM_000847 /LENGTH=52 /DNA_ID=CAMNT_0014369173 /DNA_START=43 /DNA_END=198 /DNA_ORIENTATION=+
MTTKRKLSGSTAATTLQVTEYFSPVAFAWMHNRTVATAACSNNTIHTDGTIP